MSEETRLREEMCLLAASLFARGFSVGSAGNISARLEDGVLITPTNACLGRLDPVRIAKLDRAWRHVSGDRPSKEVFMHRAMLTARAEAGAVVHLHSTWATAVSCLGSGLTTRTLRWRRCGLRRGRLRRGGRIGLRYA